MCQDCYWQACLKGELPMNQQSQSGIGYTKEFEAKLIRIKHKITFKTGMTADSIANLFKNFSGNVEVDKILYDEDKPDIISIIFHEEKVQD